MSQKDLEAYLKDAKSELVVYNAPKGAIYSYSKLKQKDVADCVEALIGAYYTTGGEAAALKVMKWLGVCGPDVNGNPVPYDEVRIRTSAQIEATGYKPTTFVPCIRDLEEQLGYT